MDPGDQGQEGKVKGELVQLIRARRTKAFEFLEKHLRPSACTITSWAFSSRFTTYRSTRPRSADGSTSSILDLVPPIASFARLSIHGAHLVLARDLLEHAPLPVDFLHPSAKAKEIVHEMRETHHFFHWELEFPDVFQDEHSRL